MSKSIMPEYDDSLEDVKERVYLMARLRTMEAEIARIKASLSGKPKPMIFNERKAYAAISGRGTPGLLFGRNKTWSFYSGDADGPSEYILTTVCDTPQEAINDIYRYGGMVYEFDTIREAMTFFLEHLKEGE